MLLRTWLPYDWTPRSEAYFASPLALCARRVSTATGGYQPSLRSPWLAAVYDLSGLDSVFWFDDHGRHLKTTEADGSLRYQFSYGAAGYLKSVTDAH
ncbi:hypothetical protein, partial [Thiolapillus sp.]